MATTYTVENFAPSDVPVVYKKDVAALIEKAVALGWSFIVKADNTATLVAPDPNQHQNIHLSARRNSGPLRRLHSKVEKYGIAAPVKVKAAPVVDFEAAADLNEQHEADAYVETELVIDKDVDVLVEDAFREIVSVKPMLSKGPNNVLYESDVANERHWSDDTVDYLCVRCDFIGATPRSMASHWGVHVRNEGAKRSTRSGKIVGTYVPESKQPKKREPKDQAEAKATKKKKVPALPKTEEVSMPDETLMELAEVLAKVMADGLDWSDVDAAALTLARAALLWDFERWEHANDDSRLLAQIRDLLDPVGRLQDEATIADLRDELAEAKAETKRARETLASFRDLIKQELM